MRTKKDARRLPAGFVDDASNLPGKNPISFVHIRDAVDDDACPTRSESNGSELPGTTPEKRRKCYDNVVCEQHNAQSKAPSQTSRSTCVEDNPAFPNCHYGKRGLEKKQTMTLFTFLMWKGYYKWTTSWRMVSGLLVQSTDRQPLIHSEVSLTI
ncbi:hypothetical protein E3N88_09665 [Mikania micrantha]|uniref:Uncharacterized protein n=1 Tax=Mikania micrantha TaxID=192012 RepID=A0A5N6PJN7_9ASTR|nr:hypothetical protein E3N88_09665 [Mikania micrantha]